TGSPQWQIESLRRLEIPEDLQRKHGFRPLGAADGPVKSAILGGNNARIYHYPVSARAALDYYTTTSTS
ncbi:MAG: amidohydrolase, partial [bacterium]